MRFSDHAVTNLIDATILQEGLFSHYSYSTNIFRVCNSEIMVVSQLQGAVYASHQCSVRLERFRRHVHKQSMHSQAKTRLHMFHHSGEPNHFPLSHTSGSHFRLTQNLSKTLPEVTSWHWVSHDTCLPLVF